MMTTGQEPELEVKETDDEVLFGGGWVGGHQTDSTDVRCFGQAEMVWMWTVEGQRRTQRMEMSYSLEEDIKGHLLM